MGKDRTVSIRRRQVQGFLSSDKRVEKQRSGGKQNFLDSWGIKIIQSVEQNQMPFINAGLKSKKHLAGHLSVWIPRWLTHKNTPVQIVPGCLFWQRVKDSNGASRHSLLAPQSSEPIEIVRVRIPRTALQKNTLVLYRTRVLFGSGWRIRTLTYRVRVCCATFTQTRYLAPTAVSASSIIPNLWGMSRLFLQKILVNFLWQRMAPMRRQSCWPAWSGEPPCPDRWPPC